MIRNRKYFEGRMGRLARMLELDENLDLQLHRYRPGNQNLYQIQIVDMSDGAVMIHLPRDLSLNSHDFDLYLNGLLDSTKLEGMWRKD